MCATLSFVLCEAARRLCMLICWLFLVIASAHAAVPRTRAKELVHDILHPPQPTPVPFQPPLQPGFMWSGFGVSDDDCASGDGEFATARPTCVCPPYDIASHAQRSQLCPRGAHREVPPRQLSRARRLRPARLRPGRGRVYVHTHVGRREGQELSLLYAEISMSAR